MPEQQMCIRKREGRWAIETSNTTMSDNGRITSTIIEPMMGFDSQGSAVRYLIDNHGKVLSNATA